MKPKSQIIGSSKTPPRSDSGFLELDMNPGFNSIGSSHPPTTQIIYMLVRIWRSHCWRLHRGARCQWQEFVVLSQWRSWRQGGEEDPGQHWRHKALTGWPRCLPEEEWLELGLLSRGSYQNKILWFVGRLTQSLALESFEIRNFGHGLSWGNWGWLLK